MTVKSYIFPLLPAAFAMLFLIGSGTAFAATEEPVSITTRPGVTQGFYFTAPAGKPVANLVLFMGGQGKLENYKPADINHGNFLVRSRNLFVKEGFAVAVIDAPSDESGGMERFRLSKEHASDIAAVVKWLHAKNRAPVWLVGTSRGTISAANGAANAEGVAGLVLTSSITLQSKDNNGTVFETDLGKIKSPVLLVENRSATCGFCPFYETDELLAHFAQASPKALISVEGGAPPKSGPCEALSAHGYFGIEESVVKLISDWIKHPHS